MSVCLCVRVFVCLCVSVHLSVCLYICVSVQASAAPSVPPPTAAPALISQPSVIGPTHIDDDVDPEAAPPFPLLARCVRIHAGTRDTTSRKCLCITRTQEIFLDYLASKCNRFELRNLLNPRFSQQLGAGEPCN